MSVGPRRVDVCNGDADGLCAVLQWRLHAPAPSTLVTGLKRDIELLRQVDPGTADEVLVCDVSMLRNHAALLQLLAGGATVRWFDHHVAPNPLPASPALQAHLDFDRDACSSLLVDRFLNGQFRAWALVGIYGDNLARIAEPLARDSGFDAEARRRLQRIGEAINYNAYGETDTDVLIAPRALYARMAQHADPLAFAQRDSIVDEIDRQRDADLQAAHALQPAWEGAQGRVTLLPDAPWSRRVVGSLANAFSNADPDRAQAVLMPLRRGGYRVSVRAPKTTSLSASDFCARFGGAGRAQAAGIDTLSEAALSEFIAAFATAWQG
jgi:nanoRNase/pAp phosphatase (c-di-AMP/oligoRNAs hydrolase)